MSSEEVAKMEAEMAQMRRCSSPGQGGVPVTVVYYLCRSGRHLEHPHMLEMHLASPNQALYLRDVICRLDELRGKGMATMYSWSCKRRYKTRFVWHDVMEDDMLLPAQESEYVLKGSLLPLRHSTPPIVGAAPPTKDHDQLNIDTTIIPKAPCVKANPHEESPTHSQKGWTTNSSSSPPMVEDEEPPPVALHQGSQPALSSISPSSCCTTGDGDDETASPHPSCSGRPSSPNKSTTKGSSGGTLYPTPSSLALHSKQMMPGCCYVIAAAQDLATQTQGISTGKEIHKDTSCSTDSTPAKATIPTNNKQRDNAGYFYSRSGRSGTLESLIRAEAHGRRVATAKRTQEEDDDKEAVQSFATKLNPANLLMRLVACGSTMSARQHLPACSLMRTAHKPRYLTQHVEFLPSSPVLSPLGTLIMRPRSADEARGASDSGDCNHCRGKLLQTTENRCESGKVMSTIVRPSSHCDHNSVSEKEVPIANLDNLEDGSKLISQKIRMAPCQQHTSGTFVTTDVGGEQKSNTLSRSTSKKMINPSSRPSRVSFHDEREKVIKIEESVRSQPYFNHRRLASRARVIIQCAPLITETYISAKSV
ncbi:Protein UPSTREAM OF FLC [Zea mays]|uniref:Protein UPSTREAM OF FLC n=2 Tax=Zea mays TaxID=4577 RepID=A0A1D6I0A6_MAIZE|nr:Protein UPSTREAM OF FLC [Zea mays]PWZ15962.1 Protein UPSTREAM OF FLC [Zea mays]